jgi:SulP family sulfate permease
MYLVSLPTKRVENVKAWLSVATINIPLSISLALASGLDPLTWLLTGIWGCWIAALTTSSRHNVFGIAGALSWIILLFVREFGAERVPLLTIMSGLLIVLIRFLGIVKYITLIPSSALHGFVIGVWLIIMTNQLPDLTWLHTLKSNGILSLVSWVFTQIWSWDFITLGIWGAVLAFLLLRKRFVPQFPGVLIATVGWAVLGLMSNYLWLWDLMLLQDKYPNLNFSLIAFPTELLNRSWVNRLPLFTWLFKTALVIAIISIVETIVSAKIATKMTKEWFDKEQEVQWLWITNLIWWFLGIAPSTAVFVRTALNIKSWATERSAAFITAWATALIGLFFFKNFFLYIPLNIIAAILISIAISMVNVRLIHEASKIEKAQWYLIVLVALITFFEDPIFGILTWVWVSLLMQIAEKTKPHLQCTRFYDWTFVKKATLQEYCCDQDDHHVLVIKLPSEITYLNSDIMLEEAKQIVAPTHVIFSCSQLYSVDIDGLEIIDELIDELSENACTVHLTWVTEIKEQLAHLKWFPVLEAEWRIRESTSQCLDACLAKQA